MNPSGSSLACPDWPTCYGTFFPEMSHGVEFEHTHRVVATLVGALTLALAASIWWSRPEDRGLRRLGGLAAFLVVIQGGLGGLTVIYRLPTAVSTAHLALACFFFCLLIVLSFRLQPGAEERRAPRPLSDSRLIARKVTAVAAVVVYLQIVLGGLVRHLGAGHSCPEVPFCYGSIWPAFGPGQLHMLHRVSGLAVLVAVVGASVVMGREGEAGRLLLVRLMAWVAPWAVVLQIILGVWTVLTQIHWFPAALHLGLAAFLLASLVAGFLGLGLRAEESDRESPDLSPDAGAFPLSETEAPA